MRMVRAGRTRGQGPSRDESNYRATAMGCGGVPDLADAKSRRGAPGGRTGALPRGGTPDQFVSTTPVRCRLCWQGGAGEQPLSLLVAGSVYSVRNDVYSGRNDNSQIGRGRIDESSDRRGV